MQTYQRDVTDYEALDAISLMIKLHDESRLTEADIPAEQLPAVPAALRQQPWPQNGLTVALPPALTQSYPLLRSVQTRQAIRDYDPTPIQQAELATILKVASDGDKQDWLQQQPDADENEAAIALHLLVVAWRVCDLAPAIYYYQAESHSLLHIGAAPISKQARNNLTLQAEFAEAPVIVLITGNLAAACTRYGGWGHRQLLLRAGAAGHRLWLASVGLGLAGTTFAGFLPRAAQSIAWVNNSTNASLFAYSVGYEPGSAGSTNFIN